MYANPEFSCARRRFMQSQLPRAGFFGTPEFERIRANSGVDLHDLLHNTWLELMADGVKLLDWVQHSSVLWVLRCVCSIVHW